MADAVNGEKIMKKIMMAMAAVLMAGGVYASGESEAARSGGFDSLAVKAADLKILADAKDAAIQPAVSDNGSATLPVEWITIPGGKFKMGTYEFADTLPIREVTIKTFEMMKTAVTVDMAGDLSGICNWGKAGRQLHPVNCITWRQANKYAEFKGVRLPSESEWEYAATSGGKERNYPWGDGKPTCNTTVMYGYENHVCGYKTTMPVCSKPAGNTEQGLCDMTGNVWQWVQDKYKDSYYKAPSDGSAVKTIMGGYHVVRGGAFNSDAAIILRSDIRGVGGGGRRLDGIGFRLAR